MSTANYEDCSSQVRISHFTKQQIYNYLPHGHSESAHSRIADGLLHVGLFPAHYCVFIVRPGCTHALLLALSFSLRILQPSVRLSHLVS